MSNEASPEPSGPAPKESDPIESAPIEPYKSIVSHDETVSNDEASAASVTGSAPQRRPWLTPAIIIVAIAWALMIIPGKLYPMTMIHFISMQVTPIVMSLALLIWWMCARRLSWRTRFSGAALAIAIIIATFMFSHPSLIVVLVVNGLPIALTVLVALMLAARKSPWPKQGLIGLMGFAAILLGSLFFRVGEIDAAFAFTLVPRWTPTEEEEFLAKIDSSEPSGGQSSKEISLPPEPAATDWAEFRGPDRDGVLRGVRFNDDWETNPPTELWRRDVGPGWSSFCVVGNVFFTQEQRGEEEAVVAYEIETGNPIWISRIPARFEASMGGIGPRATPTYSNGELFVTGAHGAVQCLDAKNGDVKWSYHLVNDLGAGLHPWGFASSPLVQDDQVVVCGFGGNDKAVVALNRADGSVVWTSGMGSHAYSSPHFASISGVDQILVSSNEGVQSLNPKDGEVLWTHNWDIGEMARVTQPLVVGDAVYLGTGYGNGTRRIDIAYDGNDWKASEAWTSQLKPYFNDCVHHEGNLYGFDGPIMMCVDAETGDRVWKGGRYGHGQLLLVEEMGVLLVISEKGELVLVDASPAKHKKRTGLKAIDGVTWNHPVIVNGRLLVRNAKEMACYELPDYKSSL